MKTKIFTILALILSVAMFTSGAFAWFTNQKTVTGTVSTGTFGIKIASSPAADGVGITAFGDTATPWTFNNIAPGDVRSGCLWVQNTGTLGTARANFFFTGLTTTGGGTPPPGTTLNLADRLIVTSLIGTDKPTSNWVSVQSNVDSLDKNGDHLLSLAEISDPVGWNDGTDAGPFVDVTTGAKNAFCLTFQMKNEAGTIDNPYQGATLSYTTLVTAYHPGTRP